MTLKVRDLGLTYAEAMQGVQSGVMYEHFNGSDDGSPKHLRVGVNSALINDAALAMLLINKGIISLEEYKEAIRLHANEELAKYEERNTPASFR